MNSATQTKIPQQYSKKKFIAIGILFYILTGLSLITEYMNYDNISLICFIGAIITAFYMMFMIVSRGLRQ